MFERYLQEGENVVMYDSGIYAGKGFEGRTRQGVFVLTDRRLIVIEGGVSNVSIFITTFIGGLAGSTLGISEFFSRYFGTFDVIFILFIVGLALGFVTSKIFRPKIVPKLFKGVASMGFADINSVERASRGLYRNMIKVAANDGRICKISCMKNKENWRDAIEKSVNKNAG